jgi:chromosome segregation ATPase
MDARTKALSDALEDIQAAGFVVEEIEKRVQQTREDVTVLRVDAELERKRLRQELLNSNMSSRQRNEYIRQIDRKVDDAARALRYEQMRLETARHELADIEARHWALLSFYDPAKAKQDVEDALRELKDTEPAVRRHSETLYK